jgi:hypothetical protein
LTVPLLADPTTGAYARLLTVSQEEPAMPNYLNFHNDETFHVYTWLDAQPADYTDGFVTPAFEELRLAPDDWAQIDPDTSMDLRRALGRILQSAINDKVRATFDLDANDHIGESGNGSDSWLFGPLATNAVANVRWLTVAEALLRDKGKWAPEKELPEYD